jgi:hypothetical protein
MTPKGVYDFNGRSSTLLASRQGHKLSLSNLSDINTEAVPVRSLSALKRYPHVSSIDNPEDLLQALMPSGCADKDEVNLLQLADAVDDLRCQCASVSTGTSRIHSAYTSPTSTPTATQRKPASRKTSPTPHSHFPTRRKGSFAHALPPSTMSSSIAGQWNPPILASSSEVEKVAKRSALNLSQSGGGGGVDVKERRRGEEGSGGVDERRGEAEESGRDGAKVGGEVEGAGGGQQGIAGVEEGEGGRGFDGRRSRQASRLRPASRASSRGGDRGVSFQEWPSTGGKFDSHKLHELHGEGRGSICVRPRSSRTEHVPFIDADVPFIDTDLDREWAHVWAMQGGGGGGGRGKGGGGMWSGRSSRCSSRNSTQKSSSVGVGWREGTCVCVCVRVCVCVW